MSSQLTPSFSRLGRHSTLALVFFAVLFLYLATLSRHASGDSIEYALVVENPTLPALLDPYHPLLHPLGLWFLRLWQGLGWGSRALVPLQVLNAIAGALCASLICAMSIRITGVTWIASLTGLGFAVSGGAWLLSVDAEFVTPALALQLLTLALVVMAGLDQRQQTRYAWLLALTTWLATMAYASAALLIPIVMSSFLFDRNLGPELRRRQAWIYAGLSLLLIAPSYLLVLSAWSQADLARVLAYFWGRGSYGQFDWFNLPHGVYAILRSLALYPNLSLTGTTRQFLSSQTVAGQIRFGLYYTGILILVLAPLFIAWRRRHHLWTQNPRVLMTLGMWTLLFSVFGFYWVPGDLSFWLPTLGAWWLLVGLLLGNVLEKKSSPQTQTPRHLIISLATIGAVTVLGVMNLVFEIGPRHDQATNHAYLIAERVRELASQDDQIVTRCDDVAYAYLVYYSQRRPICVAADVDLSQIIGPQTTRPPAMTRILIVDSSDQDAWIRALLARCTACREGVWQPLPGHYQGPGSLVTLGLAPSPD